jgi:membrane protease YdiL (CAAX protease family)
VLVRRSGPVAEVLVLTVITLPLALALRFPTLWFVTPFLLITFTGRRYERFGLTLAGLGSLRFHLLVCLIVLGLYAVGHVAVGHWLFGLGFHPTLRADFIDFAFGQIFIIGLSEEFFFRGYAQTRLNHAFGRPYRLFGARWGWGLVAAALLFGLCHIVDGNVARMKVVFFGLFAGWLRERSPSIAVPAAYHGLSNILYDFLQRSLH